MQAEACAHHQEADRRDSEKGGKGQYVDIADERHGEAWQSAAFQRARHALVARSKKKPERRCCRGGDVERNAGHDEISAKPVDRKRHQPAESCTCDERCQQANSRASGGRTGQNGNERRRQHHAFHADIEDARAVGNHHAECCQQQRCRHAQDGADEGWVENLCENHAHGCTPACTTACSPSRLRRLRTSRNTVG